ncbi:hypothetical protein EDC01DRAFT_781654 [Geopyxis carbonaria]|nr:hypothetical protein EDC01DRAFT_781654 [Geopyxis carbonaria]
MSNPVPTLPMNTTPPSMSPPPDCAICLSAVSDLTQLARLHACGHLFHTTCILRLKLSSAAASALCPSCRTPWTDAALDVTGASADLNLDVWIPAPQLWALYDRYVGQRKPRRRERAPETVEDVRALAMRAIERARERRDAAETRGGREWAREVVAAVVGVVAPEPRPEGETQAERARVVLDDWVQYMRAYARRARDC